MTDPGDVSRPSEDEHRRRRLLAAVSAAALAAVVAFTVWVLVDRSDPDETSDPATAGAGSPAQRRAVGAASGGCADGAPRALLDRFAETTFEVTSPEGASAFRGCALLAESPEARSRGLMGQDDLLGYDAMVFRFPAASTSSFYMFQTTLALSIAFVDAAGAVVSTTDMEPCPAEEAADCPTYAAAAPYLHAVEVERGDLPSIGIVPGATVTFEEAA